MSLIRALGYLVVSGPVEEWRQYGTEVLGAQVASSSTDQELRLRTDERAFRIVIQEGPAAGPMSLVALGLETGSPKALAELEELLTSRGVSTHEDPELAARRQVRRLVTFTDADGNTIEAFYGQATDNSPFASPRGVRFVTGDLGVGHTFLLAADPDSNVAFYTDVLGFEVSDTIDFGIAMGTFLHCNPRHHSMALANFPGAPTGIGHLMLEVGEIESVGRALDVVQAAGIPIVMSIGEHTNDLMKSFYMKTPSGFDIEYGWDGLLIDDQEWTVGHHNAASIWGHHFSQPPPAPEKSDASNASDLSAGL